MDRKTRLFFISYLLAGALSLFMLTAARVPTLARALCPPPDHKYGDLYPACRVRAFRVPKTDCGPAQVRYVNRRGINDAEVVFLGDSFMRNDFAARFEALSGLPVYVYWKSGSFPVAGVLKELGLKRDGRAKYVVLEKVERDVPDIRGDEKGRPVGADKEPGKGGGVPGGGCSEMLEYIVTRNALAEPLLEGMNTFRFRVFGEISEKTPVYRTDIPMVFFYREVLSNRAGKDPSPAAEEAAALARALRKEYGVRLVFMPVPNKYTIYGYGPSRGGDISPGEAYDGYLPELYRRLDESGVEYVDLYGPFMQSEKILYYPADTHWNIDGIDLAAEQLSRRLGGSAAVAEAAPRAQEAAR